MYINFYLKSVQSALKTGKTPFCENVQLQLAAQPAVIYVPLSVDFNFLMHM